VRTTRVVTVGRASTLTSSSRADVGADLQEPRANDVRTVCHYSFVLDFNIDSVYICCCDMTYL